MWGEPGGWAIPLYFVSSGVGAFLVVGCVWLLTQQKITIDMETKQPVDIQLPMGFRVKSTSPLIAVILCGVFLVTLPFLRAQPPRLELDQVELQGEVAAAALPLWIYAAPVNTSMRGPGQPGKTTPFTLTVPRLPGSYYQKYEIVYVGKDGFVYPDDSVDLLLQPATKVIKLNIVEDIQTGNAAR